MILAAFRAWLGPVFAKAAPYAFMLLFQTLLLGGAYWAGHNAAVSASRAEVLQDQVDALTTSLKAQRATADLIAKDRIKLEKASEMLDNQTRTLRQLIRQGVDNDNLQDWYAADANTVERLALYGLPPQPQPGTAVPDIRQVPDPSDTPAIPGSARVAGTIH